MSCGCVFDQLFIPKPTRKTSTLLSRELFGFTSANVLKSPFASLRKGGSSSPWKILHTHDPPGLTTARASVRVRSAISIDRA